MACHYLGGLLTDLGCVFSVVVQGDEAVWFFMVALSIDVMRAANVMASRCSVAHEHPIPLAYTLIYLFEHIRGIIW